MEARRTTPSPSKLTPLLLAAALSAQGLRPEVSDVAVTGAGADAAVSLTIGWANAWSNDRNHDAAWLVLRGPDPRAATLRLRPDGHAIEGADVPGRVRVADDGVGAFVEPAAPCRGAVRFRVTLRTVEPPPADPSAWAVAMVFVPGGAFQAGDDAPATVRFGAFHGVDADGTPVGPVWIDDEAELPVAKEPGALWYRTDQYRGDQLGPIPAAWPKGTAAFYVMKRELSQGEYAAWLRALPPEWQQVRAPLALQGAETETCSIAAGQGGFVAAAPDRPCNFMSWDDTCAFLDWHGLRPMTELEFEKAARGPRRPMPGDYPWGTDAMSDCARRVTRARDLELATVADEAVLDDDTRARLGASHWWVLDLAGSVWERVVSAGHPVGRAFRGSHGDGALTTTGTATNADWPRQVDGGDAAPGIGYRGGAEYFAAPKPDDPTNPFSRVAVRTYGAWDGGQRYKTYSARGVRTAPAPRLRTPTEAERRELSRELLARRERDQAVRTVDLSALPAAERERARRDGEQVDLDNTARMREITSAFGWPGRAMVGAEAADAAFLLVQHADRDPAFQERCLDLLRAAVAQGDAAPSGLAYLVDRVRLKQQRPQPYGTQYVPLEDDDGGVALDGGRPTYLPPIVEDPARLDARRAEMGLGPWLDYERQMAALQEREPVTAPRAWRGEWPVHGRRR